ncbi:MAG: mechanosensitive ion channel [Archangiaceae bacterium]|nr:mechanosensitive ion channel [Archangiaceae bacterium]
MPESLRGDGAFGLERWQALAVPAVALLAAASALLLAQSLAAIGARLALRSAAAWDDALVQRLRGPVRLFGWGLLMRLAYPALALPPRWEHGLGAAAQTVMGLGLFWALFRAVTLGAAHVGGSVWARDRPGARSLVSLGTSVARAALLAAAAVTVFSALGYPVTSLLAGLGLGGLALALAAQKTVENLFGAFALAVDQPFREGDFVKVDDFVGTVERIGMRSTRFRTLDRTVIAVPNGKLADARLETFAARDRIRLACTVGLTYGTSSAQLREVLAGLEASLRGHPKIWPDAVVVRFKELAASSLDVEVMAWFLTSDFGEFQAIRQDVLLSFLEVVERAGASFAFPTRTVHLVR